MLTYLIAAGVTLLLFRVYVGAASPRTMFDVYSRPGIFYYPKVATCWLLLLLRRLWAGYGTSAAAGDGAAQQAGYGVKSRASDADMDCVQQLGPHPKALDAVLIQGANREGGWLVAAVARRPHRVLNAILVVGVPGVGTLQLARHPDTTLFGTDDVYGGEGVLLRPLQCMRRWKLDFSGQMRMHETGRLVDVALDLTFTSDLARFDFDTDMAPLAVSRAMALEPWNREFFRRLRDAHQTHYEQIGTTVGTVTVAGTAHPLRVTGMRDHSFAHCRDWTLLHRYGMHTLIMEDGTRAQVGVVSQPYSLSRLEIGYLYTPEGRLHALDWCDLELGYHGEQGDAPRDYGFSFAAGGRTYHALVRVQESHTVRIGWEWEARVLERRCTYSVDGVAAHGVSEWYYRHHGGRPDQYAASDPAWVKDIQK